MTKVKGIVFDKDGTLFDFSRSWGAWAVGFLERMTDATTDSRALGQAIGFNPDTRQFSADSIFIAGTPEDIATVLTPYLPDRTEAEIVTLINREAVQAPQVEAVELMPLLSELRTLGIALGVATNDAEQPALAHLHAAGIAEEFDFIAGSDSGFGSKPAPGQINAFFEHTGLAATECLMVGDSTHDLIAGRRAGVRCVGVLTGIAGASTLAPLADVVLPDIGHLPQWLQDQMSE